MLTLKTTLKIWEKDRPDIALDKHDNMDHRTSYNCSVTFQNQPGERSVEINLDYDTNGNIVQI